MDSLKPNSHRLIYFMEEKKTLRALWCPWRLSGHACARRVKTVSNHLNPIPPGLFEGGAAWGGGGGGGGKCPRPITLKLLMIMK